MRPFVAALGRSGFSAGMARRFESLTRWKEQASPAIGGRIQTPIHFDGVGRAMSARPTSHPADHQTTRPSNQQVGSPARLPTIIQPNPSRGERLLCWGSFRPRARGRQRAKPTSDPANFAIWRAPIRLAAGICKDHCRKSRVSEPLRPDGVVIICHRLSSYLSPMFSDTNDADFAFFRAGGMENCVFRSHRARICHRLSSFVILFVAIFHRGKPAVPHGAAITNSNCAAIRASYMAAIRSVAVARA